MFDFTKEVSLDQKNYDSYKKWQMIVYVLAFCFLLYLAYQIIFPTLNYTFSFVNPNSSQNSSINPVNGQGNLPDHGKIGLDDNLIFSKVLPGNYSEATVNFTVDKDSSPLDGAEVSARKSYRSFFYPDGDPIGLKNGTLVKYNDGYFMISQGKLRKFMNSAVMDKLGFNKDSFIQAGNNDLKYNEKGDDITGENYPDDTIFKINDEFYILENQTLKKFISQNAFLTQYSENQAITKDPSFLNNFPVDQNLLGFADGALISYGISAFIVSSGKILPINNAATFISKGYNWNDIVSASGDEISLYAKDKLFNIDSPHPDGTIFEANDSTDWYMIMGGKKHLLSSDLAALTWSKKTPISVSKGSLDTKEICQLKKNIFDSRRYSCTVSFDNLKDLIGMEYEFNLNAADEINLNNLDFSVRKKATWDNFKSAVIGLLSRIKGNYVPQSAPSIQ